jgi:hypothetical protein
VSKVEQELRRSVQTSGSPTLICNISVVDPDPVGSETFGRIRIQQNDGVTSFGSGYGSSSSEMQATKFAISQQNAPLKKHYFAEENCLKNLEIIKKNCTPPPERSLSYLVNTQRKEKRE